MKRARSFQIVAPRNPFRLLPFGQAVIRRAAAAGVDTRDRAAIEAWRADGEPDADGVVQDGR